MAWQCMVPYSPDCRVVPGPMHVLSKPFAGYLPAFLTHILNSGKHAAARGVMPESMACFQCRPPPQSTRKQNKLRRHDIAVYPIPDFFFHNDFFHGRRAAFRSVQRRSSSTTDYMRQTRYCVHSNNCQCYRQRSSPFDERRCVLACQRGFPE